jgi:hypothetical protein
MYKTHIVILIICVFFLQGCPVPALVTPAINGKVIDKNTRGPVANVSVYYAEYPKQVAITNNLGEFSLKEHREIRFVPPIGDPMYLWEKPTLIVNKPGCAEYSIRWENDMYEIELDCKESKN